MALKAVPSGKKFNGLRSLPTKVRNKMGYKRRGGRYPGGGSIADGMYMGREENLGRRRMRAGGTKRRLASYQDMGEIRDELIDAGLDPDAVDTGMQNYQVTGDLSSAVGAGMYGSGNMMPNPSPMQTSFARPGYNMMGMSGPGTMGFNYMAPGMMGPDPALTRIGDRFMRRAARKEGRDLMREMRQARRADRREERQARRADRRENRQERRMDRRMDRQARKMGRINARSERQQARRDRRMDRKRDRMYRRNMM
tara:strand:+ start:882 stop:1643 length:762 start_codon:yes stop_codon:yes gene_type:complete